VRRVTARERRRWRRRFSAQVSISSVEPGIGDIPFHFQLDFSVHTFAVPIFAPLAD